ncbi:unnamed protein product [marine sediment metagenome]|uniref:Uncharacterized protein n=1 Tax=marine sediment metagenome TaxID=412755 RepID=X1EL52_9ZZZZ
MFEGGLFYQIHMSLFTSEDSSNSKDWLGRVAKFRTNFLERSLI